MVRQMACVCKNVKEVTKSIWIVFPTIPIITLLYISMLVLQLMLKCFKWNTLNASTFL